MKLYIICHQNSYRYTVSIHFDIDIIFFLLLEYNSQTSFVVKF